jgi:hypothetical protein
MCVQGCSSGLHPLLPISRLCDVHGWGECPNPVAPAARSASLGQEGRRRRRRRRRRTEGDLGSVKAPSPTTDTPDGEENTRIKGPTSRNPNVIHHSTPPRPLLFPHLWHRCLWRRHLHRVKSALQAPVRSCVNRVIWQLAHFASPK